jgi:hypothetical protein
VVTFRRAQPFDVGFHRALSATLQEWASEEEDEAFREPRHGGPRRPCLGARRSLPPSSTSTPRISAPARASTSCASRPPAAQCARSQLSRPD